MYSCSSSPYCNKINEQLNQEVQIDRILYPQRDFELLSFLVIVLAVKNRKWKPGIFKLVMIFLMYYLVSGEFNQQDVRNL